MAPHRSLRTVSVVDAVIGTATLVGLVLVARRGVLFGSKAGNHFYIYVAPLGVETIVLAILGIPIVVGLHEFARRYVDVRPHLVVLLTFAAGVALQLVLHSAYPYSMAETIVSDGNAFYGATELAGPRELMRDFDRLMLEFGGHVQGNMPGKILFYHLLRSFSSDPRLLAVVIVALSSLVGVLLYGIVVAMFGDRRLGVDVMVLWMIVPAKVSNLPLLNVVSPIPALVAIWLMMRFLAKPRIAWAVLIGILTYATVFFDPLVLWLGLIFVSEIARAVLTGRAHRRDALLLVGLSSLALLATHVAVKLATGFDAWKRLRDIVAFSDDFNRKVERPYAAWLTGNVKEVALAVGPAVTVSVVAALGHAVSKIWHARQTGARTAFLDPGVMITVSFAAVFAIHVLLGQNRSEVPRLWIFYFAAMQVLVVWWCAEQRGDLSRRLVIAGTFAYSAVTVATVGYCLP